MSDLARAEYSRAREDQLDQNEARRIRSKVEGAESDSGLAGRRWPFELLQNAHDAGPRPGADAVDVELTWDHQSLIVSHTGKPFEPQELAALLSGGSSKEYEDESTTGRFGTGFLVTHALSTEVDVEGILNTTEGFELFRVPLRRGGDEASIVKNIDDARSALGKAHRTGLAPDVSTARLVYRDADEEVVQLGLERLKQALPYLYATCDYLGAVRIVEAGQEVVFQPRQAEPFRSSSVNVQGIAHTTPRKTRHLAVLRATGGHDDRAAALVLTQEVEDATTVLLPGEDFPRVFVTFPIAGSQFLPFDVVLDGKFKPAQERDSIQMTPEDRRLFERALGGLPGLLKTAVDSKWEGAHHLARLSAPTQTFAKEAGEDEQTWWQATIKQVASSMAKKPVVRTETGLLPAVSKNGKPCACFAVPAADANSTCAWPAPLNAMHALVSRVEGLQPVELDIARPWEGVSENWQHLGVPVRRIGLAELAAQVKKRNRSVAQLPVKSSPHQWLAHFLELAGELDVADRSLFKNLLPDQHGELRNPDTLRFDEGIAEEVKDAAALIGLDLRKELLHPAFVEEVSQREKAERALESLVSSKSTEKEAVERVIRRLRDKLPDDDEVSAEAKQAMKASARLAAHLGPESEKLRELPYVLKDGTVVRMKRKSQHLAPISEWPEAERAYASLYPEERVLAEEYASEGSCHVGLSPAIEGNRVLPSIVHRSVRESEVSGDLLAELTGRDDLSEVALRKQTFEQIALLSSVVVQRCGKDEQLAKLLLDFVLHVAVQSPLWKEMRTATGAKNREAVELEVCAALWPAELSVRPWIPRKSEEETVPFPASESVLNDFLQPEQIRDNEKAADFLHKWFGFSPLQLYLKGLEEGEERNALEADLAKLSRAGATALSTLAQADASTIQEVAQTVADKQRQDQFKKQNRQFGIAVQEAVESVFSEEGFDLDLIDHGFDYLMAPGETVEPDELRYAFESEEYLLEVKATTTGEVHLTPTQAKTAAKEKERFLLCVVDLRGTPRSRLSEPWKPEDIRGKCHLLAVGAEVEETVGPVLSLAATDGSHTIRLRNEGHLRYAVPTALWKSGLSIEKWAQRYVSGEKMSESKSDRTALQNGR